MDSLATDVLKQIKRDEVKTRTLIIIISLALLIATNFFWFAIWNAPPKEREDEEILFELEGNDDDNDNPQSENEKSE